MIVSTLHHKSCAEVGDIGERQEPGSNQDRFANVLPYIESIEPVGQHGCVPLRGAPPFTTTEEWRNMTRDTNAVALRKVKIVHTLIWAFFASSIVTIPICSFLQEHRIALTLVGIVAVEVLILLVNHMNCPLTAIAARYTDDRRYNFDIYLPEWLARHNKAIFGSLYFASVVLTLLRMP